MKRGKNLGNESLDLLLDTICNTFGAIILIAILVAIITQNAPTPNDVLQSTSAELLDRQIANAEREIEEIQEIVNAATSVSPSIASLQAERAQIKQEIQILKAPKVDKPDESRGAAEVIARQIENDAGALATAEADAARMENALEAAKQNIDRLETRLQSLKDSLGDVKTAQRREMRFPKERGENWAPVWVLFHDNRIFPLSMNRQSPNEADFSVSEDSSSITFKVKPNKGHSPEAASKIVENFAESASGSRSWYFACLVNSDSIEAFTAFRDAAAQNGMSFGWEPHDNDSVQLVTEGGSRPSPL